MRWDIYHFLLVACDNNIPILHRFPYILPLLQCTWLHVTLRSPWASISQLILHATYVFWFVC